MSPEFGCWLCEWKRKKRSICSFLDNIFFFISMVVVLLYIQFFFFPSFLYISRSFTLYTIYIHNWLAFRFSGVFPFISWWVWSARFFILILVLRVSTLLLPWAVVSVTHGVVDVFVVCLARSLCVNSHTQDLWHLTMYGWFNEIEMMQSKQNIKTTQIELIYDVIGRCNMCAHNAVVCCCCCWIYLFVYFLNWLCICNTWPFDMFVCWLLLTL